MGLKKRDRGGHPRLPMNLSVEGGPACQVLVGCRVRYGDAPQRPSSAGWSPVPVGELSGARCEGEPARAVGRPRPGAARPVTVVHLEADVGVRWRKGRG